MKRTVTVHRPADRHRGLHEREFAATSVAEVNATPLGEAIAAALADLRLADDEGKAVITVGWPHEPEALEGGGRG